MYFYRCTEQQLGDSLQHIHESGDTLHSAVYKGGRDWVLICYKGHVPCEFAVGLSRGLKAGAKS